MHSIWCVCIQLRKKTRYGTERGFFFFFVKIADSQKETSCEFQAPAPCCWYWRGQTLTSQEPSHTSMQPGELCENAENSSLLSKVAIFQLTSVTRQIGTRQIYLYGLVKTSYVWWLSHRKSFWDSCQIKIEWHDTMFIYASVIVALIYMILVNFCVFYSADTFLLRVWGIKFILMELSGKKAFCSAFLNRICLFTCFSQEMRVHRPSESPCALLVLFQRSFSWSPILRPTHIYSHIPPPDGARKVKESEISKLSCQYCKSFMRKI